MSDTPNDRLYLLLPSIYRQRDIEFGEPLRALLSVISDQVDVVERDIAGLYDNWFIETCQDWVVPYLGDLIGYRAAPGAAPAPGAAGSGAATSLTQSEVLRNRVLFPRREIANTLRYRRRKGTLALLAQLAADVTGWPARVVEFDRLLAGQQSLNHLRLAQGRLAEVRSTAAMRRIGSAFDETAHVVDLRRPQSHRTPGRFNLPSVCVFVWRLRAYPVTRTHAYCVEEVGPECFTFSVLGNDAPLFGAPSDLPARLRRVDVAAAEGHPLERYYGANRSFALWHRRDATHPCEARSILIADLSDWTFRPPKDRIAVDPELGRLAFAPEQAPADGIFVSYHYGFSMDLGGGEYARALPEWVGASTRLTVGADGDFKSLREALAHWHKMQPPVPNAVIELSGSDVHVEPLSIALNPHQSLEIRAAEGARPVIRLLDWQSHRPDVFAVTGGAGSRLVLDGLLIAGRGVQIKDQLQHLLIRHCTLVPGWDLDADALPRSPGETSLLLSKVRTRVVIEHSILGPITVTPDDPQEEPLVLSIADSIIDATAPRDEAIRGIEGAAAQVVLSARRSTFLGRVHVEAIALAENCIFNGSLRVARLQSGCMRFCYVKPGAHTPHRYKCQPESTAHGLHGAARAAEELRVRPAFASVRYGNPDYCRLTDACAPEITHGADDEAELGVFHDLYDALRLANLQARLEEYVPAGADVGIVDAR